MKIDIVEIFTRHACNSVRRIDFRTIERVSMPKRISDGNDIDERTKVDKSTLFHRKKEKTDLSRQAS